MKEKGVSTLGGNQSKTWIQLKCKECGLPGNAPWTG